MQRVSNIGLYLTGKIQRAVPNFNLCLYKSDWNILSADHGVIRIKSKGIGELRPQTDQRSDYSNLQHVKGETGRNRYKRYHMRYIIHYLD